MCVAVIVRARRVQVWCVGAYERARGRGRVRMCVIMHGLAACLYACDCVSAFLGMTGGVVVNHGQLLQVCHRRIAQKGRLASSLVV